MDTFSFSDAQLKNLGIILNFPSPSNAHITIQQTSPYLPSEYTQSSISILTILSRPLTLPAWIYGMFFITKTNYLKHTI